MKLVFWHKVTYDAKFTKFVVQNFRNFSLKFSSISKLQRRMARNLRRLPFRPSFRYLYRARRLSLRWPQLQPGRNLRVKTSQIRKRKKRIWRRFFRWTYFFVHNSGQGLNVFHTIFRSSLWMIHSLEMSKITFSKNVIMI